MSTTPRRVQPTRFLQVFLGFSDAPLFCLFGSRRAEFIDPGLFLAARDRLTNLLRACARGTRVCPGHSVPRAIPGAHTNRNMRRHQCGSAKDEPDTWSLANFRPFR